jgi:hypothetical protein
MSAKGDEITKRNDGRYMARYTFNTADEPKSKLIYGRRFTVVPIGRSVERGAPRSDERNE